jgi:hypothetical protein
MVDVRVRQDQKIHAARLKRKALEVLLFLFGGTLKLPAIEQKSRAVRRLYEMARTGDRLRGPAKTNPHLFPFLRKNILKSIPYREETFVIDMWKNGEPDTRL